MIDYRKSLHDATPGLPLVEICPLALLTDPQGNLLLVRDPDDIYWHLMGGWLTPNETIRECLQRSILNNCSILLEECSLLKVFPDPTSIIFRRIPQGSHRSICSSSRKGSAVRCA